MSAKKSDPNGASPPIFTFRKESNPFISPSYPPRVHFQERPAMERTLRGCEEKLAAYRRKLDVLRDHPNRAALERAYFQMMGVRDQIAEMTRRMPGETGGLYEEDKELYEAAIAAGERTARYWESLGG